MHPIPMATLVSQPPLLHLPQSKTRILCNKPNNNNNNNKKTDSAAFKEKQHVSVDYDSGTHHLSTHIGGFRKRDIPKHHRLRVETERFQKDWAVSDVVNRVYQLRRGDDIDGVLNRWVGRFARKNFPILIREMTARGSVEHCMQVFRWMKTLKNYCARTDIYNMLIRLHARHNLVDQARGLFFEMQEWRCKPDAESYNALINAHGRAGQWRWAMNIVDDMLRAAVCNFCIPLP